MEDLIVSKHYVDDILDNLQEKLESGFYFDKINIDGKFEIWEQEEKCLVLLCCNGKSDDGSDGLAVRLPLPLRFDEEWFKKYKENNITRGIVIYYHIDGFLKWFKDLIKYNKMSLNGIDGLTNPSNDVDAVTKNYVDNYVNKKLIKILEEGLIEISRHFDQQSYLVRAVVSRLSTIVRKLEEIRKNDSKE